MSKQQRRNAPEATKAPGDAEKSADATLVDAPTEGAPEATKAPGDAAADGEPLSPGFVAPAGKVHCRAITTCLVRGMPEFSGAEFWLEEHEAERLESKGALEIVE